MSGLDKPLPARRLLAAGYHPANALRYSYRLWENLALASEVICIGVIGCWGTSILDAGPSGFSLFVSSAVLLLLSSLFFVILDRESPPRLRPMPWTNQW